MDGTRGECVYEWDEDGGRPYRTLEISSMKPPVSVEVVVAVAIAVAVVVPRRCGSAANADAARARIMLVNFIVRKIVRKMDVVLYRGRAKKHPNERT